MNGIGFEAMSTSAAKGTFGSVEGSAKPKMEGLYVHSILLSLFLMH